jgi:hypothetical protein
MFSRSVHLNVASANACLPSGLAVGYCVKECASSRMLNTVSLTAVFPMTFHLLF